MVDRLHTRARQGHKALQVIRDLILEKVRAEEEYSAKLNAIGSKFRKEVENREELCEFPPIFTTLIGDIEQMGAARHQLREQILTEIYLPLEDYLDMQQEIPLTPDMSFVTASLAFRDFEAERQEFVKETLTKLSVVNSIIAESEDDIARRFGEDAENYNCEEFIQQQLKQDEPFFPKTENVSQKKAKKGHRVTWSTELLEVIGFSDTESKAPVFVAESFADEEAFAEIAAITGRKRLILLPDPLDLPDPSAQEEEEETPPPPKPAAPAKKSDPLDLMDAFLSTAKATSYVAEVDAFEEEEKKKKEEQERREKQEREERERQEEEQRARKAEEEQKKASKPIIPPKPAILAHDVEETKLKATVTETVSCQYLKGHLKRCDLAGQIAFSGTVRKDCRADFSFDLNDKSSIENILPNKAFVQTSPDQDYGFKCNIRALSHYISPNNPVPALKYRLIGNSIANKIPILLSVAWKCDANLTSIIINYKSLPDVNMNLEDLSLEVSISGGVTGIQAKPSVQWNPASQIATWIFGSVQLSPEKEFSGKLLGRFSVQQASTPSPVQVKFQSKGVLLSDLQVEMSQSADIALEPTQKLLVTGKYIAS